MKLLIDITGFIPNKNYGAQTFLINLLKAFELSEYSNNILIICTKETSAHFDQINLNFKPYYIPRFLPLRILYSFFLINILNIYFGPKKIFYPFNFSYTLNEKSYIFIHDLVFDYYKSKKFKFKYLKYYFIYVYYYLNFKGSQNIAVPSLFTKNELKRIFNKKGAKVLREGLSFEKTCTNKKIDSGRYVFLINSFKADHKNIQDLFNVIDKLKHKKLKKIIEFRFTGTKSKYINDLSKKINSNKLILSQTGYLSDDGIFEEICKSNCLIYCTEYEGFGLPVIEAFQLKKSIICSDLDVLKEFGYSGQLFYRNGDTQDLMKKILVQVESQTKDIFIENENSYNWINIVNWVINK